MVAKSKTPGSKGLNGHAFLGLVLLTGMEVCEFKDCTNYGMTNYLMAVEATAQVCPAGWG